VELRLPDPISLEYKLKSIFFSANIRTTSSCTLFSNPAASAGTVEGRGAEEAREEHQMRSCRTRSESGISVSICL
jgi:hypothetical protein